MKRSGQGGLVGNESLEMKAIAPRSNLAKIHFRPEQLTTLICHVFW